MTTTPETTRLHITPFTPDLLPSVIPASVRPSATGISFHCIPTFPENNYGYVTLPTMEADKIKKKLNGSILKGRKFKVEAARSPKRQEVEDEAKPVAASTPASDRKSKKRKAHDDVLDGYELQTDRRVKRGWTESTSTKKDRRKGEKKKGKDEKKTKPQAKSKYTEKSECLFRTTIPQNRLDSIDEGQEKQTKKKEKKKSSRESIVHEFAKTITHPSFLRAEGDGTAPTSNFEEGKGWVDSAGNLKEPINGRVKKDQYRPGLVAGAKEKRKPVKIPAAMQKTHIQNSQSEEKDSADESEDWTSSSGATSSDDSSMDSESEESVSSTSSQLGVSSSEDEQQQPQSSPIGKQGSSLSKADVPETVSDGDTPRTQTNHEIAPKEVHPLEALFKRSIPESSESKPAPEVNAQFSFFGQDDIESEEEVHQNHEPHTPFTKKDFLGRELRSAAPTPDTALVGRTINWKETNSDAMDIDEVYKNTPIAKLGTGPKEESEFTKWFWENRGDNNRAWKKRRRDAAKEQRQRENRSKGMKGKS